MPGKPTASVVFTGHREVRTVDGGFQLWETTTEGSPLSRVLAATEELAFIHE